jgi:proteasome activator subunit 4
MFYEKDPRRVQPLVDHLINAFECLDFDGESTFDISQVLCFFRAFYEGMNWKCHAWIDDIVGRIWTEIGCEHDEVGTLMLYMFVHLR